MGCGIGSARDSLAQKEIEDLADDLKNRDGYDLLFAREWIKEMKREHEKALNKLNRIEELLYAKKKG